MRFFKIFTNILIRITLLIVHSSQVNLVYLFLNAHAYITVKQSFVIPVIKEAKRILNLRSRNETFFFIDVYIFLFHLLTNDILNT